MFPDILISKKKRKYLGIPDITIISDISILQAFHLLIYCIISLYKLTFKFTTSHTLRHSCLGRLPGLRYVPALNLKLKYVTSMIDF